MIFWRKIFRAPFWVPACLGLLVLAVAISSQSIDMDEAQTWDYTRLSSVSQVWNELRSDPNSESQMPLGMVAMWGWCRVWGTGEMASRAINWAWAALALASLCVVARETRMRWLPLLFALQPFVWYSMDQARTPLMQMAGGAMLLAGTVLLLNGSQRRFRVILMLSVGSIILCGASMLGVIPLIVILVVLFTSAAWRRILWTRASKVVLFLTTAFLGALGFYYLSTLTRGAGGAKLWTVTPFNLVFVIYEFLGYAGLGPGRQQLRDIMRGAESLSHVFPYGAGWIGLSVGYGLVVGAAVKSWFTRSECGPRKPALRLWLFCVSVPVLSALLLFLLASVVGFPFWGRHLAGTLPFAVTALAIVFYWSMQGLWRRAGRAGSLLVVLMLAISAGWMRFSPAHRHDDYRSAVRAATSLADEGLSVWWVADHSGGEYYGLTFVESGSGVYFAFNHSQCPDVPPEAIVLSRPENFDRYGIAEKMIKSGEYQRSAKFQAFDVWSRR